MTELDAELWVVTCYYNPNAYRTKRDNFDRFIAGLEASRVPYLLIECAADAARFELPDARTTLRVRAKDPLWQKERLLNVGIAALPASCKKVAWLDCDLLFEDPEWAERTSRALDDLEVVQPFTEAVCLPQGHMSYQGEGTKHLSFGAVCQSSPYLARSGHFDLHGHTGFAWAARRGWLDRVGLYDACITGSGDHLMAHALFGGLHCGCVRNMIEANGPYREHFVRWTEAVRAEVRGRVGAVAGRVYHLWHGSDSDRKYHQRNRELRAFDFDPAADIRINDHGAWEWSSAKPALHRWARDYFGWRNEDG